MVVALKFVLLVGLLSTIRPCECKKGKSPFSPAPAPAPAKSDYYYDAISCRGYSASITDFGGVGDGKTLNTKAFQNAVNSLSKYASKEAGGSLLFVPAGKWLTGSFNLTSYFTLFLHQDAVLLVSQDAESWPVINALPSYGHGRDTKSTGRYVSFLFGANLTDVVITGYNGTIEGQGMPWWKNFKSGKLKYTRPYLIELMYSQNIQISNLTLLNSPNWNVHPVYSSNIIVQHITILAPVKSPNTDGINPDSCTNIRIVDCFIVSGDDCVAVKSGWDEYGIAVGMPTRQLWIQRLTCISPYSATIALGSEMSGGIMDVWAEDIVALNTESGVRIKTAKGRGGFVKYIHVRRFKMHTMKTAFLISGNYKAHADNNYSQSALPDIRNINYRDVEAENVTKAGRLEGIRGDEFTGICIANVTIKMVKNTKQPWICSDVRGMSSGVTPTPCPSLTQGDAKITSCDFPPNYPPINPAKLSKCSLKWNSS